MTRLLKDRYPGPGGMLAVSLGLHLAVFALILWGHLLPDLHPDQTPVTYVDMVTLPVANPQSGTPAPAAEASPRPPAAAPAAPKAEMALPASKPATAKSKAPAPSKAKPAAQPVQQAKPAKNAGKPQPDAGEREFNERMARLERQSDDRRLNDALAGVKSRAGRTGMPGAKGTEAGSDYASYVQSRLADAFAKVIVTQSKSPKVFITLTIGADGRIADSRVDRTSGDPLFDDAVARAITLAGRSLKPPPEGRLFKRGFVFEPKGVGIR